MQNRLFALATITHLNTRCGLEDWIKPRPVHPRARSGAVKGREAHVHDIGLDLGQAFIINFESLRHPGPKIMHNHIRRFDQIVENLFPCGRLKI